METYLVAAYLRRRCNVRLGEADLHVAHILKEALYLGASKT